MRIVIIGAGSVGTNLHHALSLKGVRAELVHARPLTAVEVTGDGLQVTGIPQGDCYIYTVADHVLREVVSLVHAPKALHLHTSGSMPIEVFGEDKPHAGVLYFLQSFSREVLIDDWSGIPCFIEGRDIDDIAAIYSLALTLTSRIYEANQHDRERLHIAAVFANNYSNLMFRIAAEVLKDTQIPFEALLPLIDRTAEKIHKMSPAEAQTGPAKRGDMTVINHHAEVLGATPYAELYRELAALIAKAHNH
jgi:predicted short-subunit dehydrogenase-like oxidoreductase (DUF2520 family)